MWIEGQRARCRLDRAPAGRCEAAGGALAGCPARAYPPAARLWGLSGLPSGSWRVLREGGGDRLAGLLRHPRRHCPPVWPAACASAAHPSLDLEPKPASAREYDCSRGSARQRGYDTDCERLHQRAERGSRPIGTRRAAPPPRPEQLPGALRLLPLRPHRARSGLRPMRPARGKGGLNSRPPWGSDRAGGISMSPRNPRNFFL
jgi:hypothetical protein